jgi:5-methylcytosine-specific restriction endonuclease McrA
MQSVLVLNATYQPLSIVSAKRAIHLIISEKASPLDASDVIFHSAKATFNVPYVILLTHYVKVSDTRQRVPFSRRGVLARDNNTCVYCGKHAETIDHVVPRAAGGTSTYENCVAACKSCNSKKADKSIEQMGWTMPHKSMVPPSPFIAMLRRAHFPQQETAWKEYIKLYEPSIR